MEMLMHFLLQCPSLLHSLIHCIFFSVFHLSFTYPKHWQYHLDRIMWSFLSLSLFSFCLLDCVFLSASRAQCLVWWKGISQTTVATLSAVLPSQSLLLPVLFPLSSHLPVLIFITFSIWIRFILKHCQGRDMLHSFALGFVMGSLKLRLGTDWM